MLDAAKLPSPVQNLTPATTPHPPRALRERPRSDNERAPFPTWRCRARPCHSRPGHHQGCPPPAPEGKPVSEGHPGGTHGRESRRLRGVGRHQDPSVRQIRAPFTGLHACAHQQQAGPCIVPTNRQKHVFRNKPLKRQEATRGGNHGFNASAASKSAETRRATRRSQTGGPSVTKTRSPQTISSPSNGQRS